ncbi:MAG: hypothetical protein GY882_10195 [Actinomycetia bacterium]|nr:hypothetical protein [Actinomycetes bacterium]
MPQPCRHCNQVLATARLVEVHSVVDDYGELVCRPPADLRDRFGRRRCQLDADGVWQQIIHTTNPYARA